MKRSVKHVKKCVTRHLFVSRRRIGGSPIRFNSCATNSVGCESIGGSNGVGRLSGMAVNFPGAPRVGCNFKMSTKCGKISVSYFFRKSTHRSFLLGVPRVAPFRGVHNSKLVNTGMVLRSVTGDC